jgi:hypothetical protein
MNAVFKKFRGSTAWTPEPRWPVMRSKKAGYSAYGEIRRLLPVYLLTIKFNFDNQQGVYSALGFFNEIVNP